MSKKLNVAGSVQICFEYPRVKHILFLFGDSIEHGIILFSAVEEINVSNSYFMAATSSRLFIFFLF